MREFVFGTLEPGLVFASIVLPSNQRSSAVMKMRGTSWFMHGSWILPSAVNDIDPTRRASRSLRLCLSSLSPSPLLLSTASRESRPCQDQHADWSRKAVPPVVTNSRHHLRHHHPPKTTHLSWHAVLARVACPHRRATLDPAVHQLLPETSLDQAHIAAAAVRKSTLCWSWTFRHPRTWEPPFVPRPLRSAATHGPL